jgi:hypothetical protein
MLLCRNIIDTWHDRTVLFRPSQFLRGKISPMACRKLTHISWWVLGLNSFSEYKEIMTEKIHFLHRDAYLMLIEKMQWNLFVVWAFKDCHPRVLSASRLEDTLECFRSLEVKFSLWPITIRWRGVEVKFQTSALDGDEFSDVTIIMNLKYPPNCLFRSVKWSCFWAAFHNFRTATGLQYELKAKVYFSPTILFCRLFLSNLWSCVHYQSNKTLYISGVVIMV